MAVIILFVQTLWSWVGFNVKNWSHILWKRWIVISQFNTFHQLMQTSKSKVTELFYIFVIMNIALLSNHIYHQDQDPFQLTKANCNSWTNSNPDICKIIILHVHLVASKYMWERKQLNLITMFEMQQGFINWQKGSAELKWSWIFKRCPSSPCIRQDCWSHKHGVGLVKWHLVTL